MKKSHLSQLPIFSAIVAGLAAWIFYPNLFEFVAAPIKQSFVDTMPSELFFHRLKTAAAFSILGALVPIAAIFASRNKAKGSYRRSLYVLTALAILVASSTTWFMYENLALISKFVSELQAKDPSIPTVARVTIIPLYRVAIYPACLMLVIIAIMFVRTYKSSVETNQEGQQDAP
jgi:hypothetical protein